MQSSGFIPKSAACTRHRKQISTHICTDIKCTTSPLLCQLCFRDQLNRTYHFDHEKSILPFQQGISQLCEQIKSSTAPLHKFFKSVLVKPEYVQMLNQIQKSKHVQEELQQKIISIKSQVQLQLDLVVKEFQKTLQAQKLQYFKTLDSYQQIFVKNMESMKSHIEPIVQFNNSTKFYANLNNFQLKLNYESRKKSDWLLKTKRLIQNVQKNIQNNNLTSQFSHFASIFSRANKDSWPFWKNNQTSAERTAQFRNLFRKYINQWIHISEIKFPQQQTQVLNSNSSTPSSTKIYH